MKKLNLSLVAIVGLFFVLTAFTGGDDPKSTKIEITFVDHLTAGLIEQDVFVEKTPGSGKVFRVLPAEKEQYLDSKVYGTAKTVYHDPFDPANAGPHKKGQDMGITLRDWLQAKGSATYECQQGWGTITAKFENLQPNAVYTMWHFFMAAPPTTPFNGTLDLPIGGRDGKQSIFTTDENGAAQLDIRFERCLQLTDDQLMAGLAIALHSDGQTYGPMPGEFGNKTHVQLFAMLPDADDFR